MLAVNDLRFDNFVCSRYFTIIRYSEFTNGAFNSIRHDSIELIRPTRRCTFNCQVRLIISNVVNHFSLYNAFARGVATELQ